MTEIENLEAQLQQTTDNQQRIDVLNRLIRILGRQDLARSIQLLDEATVLVDNDLPVESELRRRAEYHLNHALVDAMRGHYEEAISHARETLAFQTEGLLGGNAQELIGICHVRLGNPSEALAALMKALEIAIATADIELEANVYNSLAILYVNLGEHPNGATYFQKSLELSCRIGDRMSEVRALVNLCMSYRDLKEYDKSLSHGYQGLRLARELNVPRLEMGCLSNLGNTYIALGEPEKAFAHFQSATQLAEQLGKIPEQAIILLSIARAYMLENQYALAKSYASLVLEVGRVHKQPGAQFEAHEMLATLYKIEGDFATALEHFEAFHFIKEQIFNHEADEKLKQLEVTHRTETAQRDAEIYQLRYVELQREITERERAQKALIHAQKLESLGILAGGVAHDFNNLLMGISGQIDLALHHLDAMHPATKNLLKANSSVEKAANLARKMLAYSGRGHFQVVRCRAKDLLEENRGVWQDIIGTECRLSMLLAPNSCCIEIDKHQLEQLFVNLLLNAVEAQATEITIQTTCRHIDENDSHFWQYTALPLPAGQYLQLTVMDNGRGMDGETLERVFDPFFTTKFTGRGLGMAAVLGIVRGHNGGITISSQLEQGTSLQIVLPTAVCEVQ